MAFDHLSQWTMEVVRPGLPPNPAPPRSENHAVHSTLDYSLAISTLNSKMTSLPSWNGMRGLVQTSQASQTAQCVTSTFRSPSPSRSSRPPGAAPSGLRNHLHTGEGPGARSAGHFGSQSVQNELETWTESRDTAQRGHGLAFIQEWKGPFLDSDLERQLRAPAHARGFSSSGLPLAHATSCSTSLGTGPV